MSRAHLYSDRVRLQRVRSRKSRGEVVEQDPVEIGTWIPCLLRTPSGKVDEQEVRTSVPEAAVLIVDVKDEDGAAVSILQGDRLEIRFNRNGVLTDQPEWYRIMGRIVETREKRRIVSYQLQVQAESEF